MSDFEQDGTAEDRATIFRQPDLHDGLLTGIRITNDSTLELFCTSVDKEDYVLRLPGVERLHAENFCEGNIVFEVLLYQRDLPEALVRRAYGLTELDQPPWLGEKIAEASTEGWTLLQVTSSYGCELVALARGRLQAFPQAKQDG